MIDRNTRSKCHVGGFSFFRSIQTCHILHFVFPGCVAKGYRFSLGVWVGVETLSLDAAFATATVRNGPQPFAVRALYMAVPLVSAGGFKRRVTSFRVAGVALHDVPTCFVSCQKSFCVTGARLLSCFHKMICIFRGPSATFVQNYSVQHPSWSL